MRSPKRPNIVAEWTGTILLFLFGTVALVQGAVIPTASMEPTLLVGDHVLIDKTVYAPRDSLLGALLPYREVERGDIVVFRYPLDPREYYVKRAIGLPGDRIRIRDKNVWINGRPLDEPYKRHLSAARLPYRDDFPDSPPPGLRPEALAMLAACVKGDDLVVPADAYFMMGDNRDNSDDSRYWGLVPRENIVGAPSWIYWSYEAPSEQWLDRLSVRHVADLGLNFFSRTRWERTLNPVPRSLRP